MHLGDIPLWPRDAVYTGTGLVAATEAVTSPSLLTVLCAGVTIGLFALSKWGDYQREQRIKAREEKARSQALDIQQVRQIERLVDERLEVRSAEYRQIRKDDRATISQLEERIAKMLVMVCPFRDSSKARCFGRSSPMPSGDEIPTNLIDETKRPNP